jgi:decaprenyl-phosphate phosphoribosyltransferase
MLSPSVGFFRISAAVRLIRPQQWVKNLFLFLPIFFAGQLFSHLTGLLHLCFGFLAFSFIASSIYIVNDYQDVEEDRRHPVKKHRPLAAGTVSLQVAAIILTVLLVTGFTIAYFLDGWFMMVLGMYFIFNLSYSMGLKNVPLIDIFIIALGFLLRTLAGGIVAQIPVSQWLMIMVFLLALFLALAKRRDDIVLHLSSGKHMRKSVKNYNLEFLGACLTMVSGIIIVSYIMYAISEEVTIRLGSPYIYLTSIFVIAGLMRYLQIAMVENDSGSPTRILYKDTFIRATIISWIISFYILIYLPEL